MNVNLKKHKLNACRNLVAFDGADGVGKSTIITQLRQQLLDIGIEPVIVAPTKLCGSCKLESIERISRAIPRLGSAAYCIGTRYHYMETILPMLQSGRVVLLDRSEFDLVRYTLFRGNNNELRQRLDYISSGLATAGIWPSVRVIVAATPRTILRNLHSRLSNSIHDPNGAFEIVRNNKAVWNTVRLLRPLNNELSQLVVRRNTYSTNLEAQVHSVAKRCVEAILPIIG